MRLRELLVEAGYKLPMGVADREIVGIASDSRRLRAGELFVALRGLSADGNAFLEEAMARGAVFLISEQPHRGLPTLVVPDARVALARLYDAWYGHPARSLSLIGVTGTNGKTSVATMLFSIFRHAGCSCGLIGTVEARFGDEVLDARGENSLANMTTPDPAELYRLLRVLCDRGARYVVMEVTSHALALSKVEPLSFSLALFTNLSEDHLDFHGDMESYFLEKCKLFERAQRAVISHSTPFGRRLCEALDIPTFAVSPQTVREVKLLGADGVSFTLDFEGEPLRLSLPVPGAFSVENGALAAAAALLLGLSRETVATALSQFEGVKGRMECFFDDRQGITVIFDYAHTPDALEKLLSCVRGFRKKGQRILLLFGCGGDRDRSKRRLMGQIGSRLADFLILTSDNSRSEAPEAILREILRGVDKERPFCTIVDRGEAIRYAVLAARRGDILLLAGKGHEEYEIRGSQRLPFSEREIVKKALAEREEGAGNEG